MNNADLKTCILMIPYVFKGDNITSDTDKIAYVTSHFNELLDTLPISVMQELSDAAVKDQLEEYEKEFGTIKKERTKTKREDTITHYKKENKILREQRDKLLEESKLLRERVQQLESDISKALFR